MTINGWIAVLGDLRSLGLGDYEARAFVALLQHPGSNGYELAKASGIPRAKVYEVLAGLVVKGVVEQTEVDGRSCYLAIDANVFLDRFLASMRDTVDRLRPALNDITARDHQPTVITLRSEERILGRAREMIAKATASIFVAAFPREAMLLGAPLLAAEARGVSPFVLTFGEVDLSLSRHFVHSPVELDRRRGAMPWLVLSIDHHESITADLTSATAVWTDNPTLSLIAAEYVKHDIFLVEQSRLLDARGISLDRDMYWLQEMWFDQSHGGEKGRTDASPQPDRD